MMSFEPEAPCKIISLEATANFFLRQEDLFKFKIWCSRTSNHNFTRQIGGNEAKLYLQLEFNQTCLARRSCLLTITNFLIFKDFR